MKNCIIYNYVAREDNFTRAAGVETDRNYYASRPATKWQTLLLKDYIASGDTNT